MKKTSPVPISPKCSAEEPGGESDFLDFMVAAGVVMGLFFTIFAAMCILRAWF